MKKIIITCLLVAAIPFLLTAQQNQSYAEIANQRAAKIVDTLNINTQQKKQIKDLVANQYIELNKLHSQRDKLLTNDESKNKLVKEHSAKSVSKLHHKFLSSLNSALTPQQVDEVKNGMTYHTVPLTYNNYLLMLPYLNGDEKSKIKDFLEQARETAMDAGSAKEKHAVFNNFKGKIANYLSSKGYQLKLEGQEWAKRRDLKSAELEIIESNRIMAALNLTDLGKKETIRNLVAYQYQQIAKIQQAKTARQEAIKKTAKTTTEIENDNQAGWEESKKNLDTQRDVFTNALKTQLSSEQVELVKNEMTAQSVQKEYDKFNALLPDLTDDQKKKVYDYLIEARENAISVLTSRERNQWFAKYRGRANNYLSAQGYNLRKATEELEKKTGIKQ